MKQRILQEIGLTESEEKVYLTLLKIGDSTRGKIVEESNINGSKIYEVLDKLKDKGLVSIYLEKGIKHFKPLNPKQLLSYVDDKKSKLADLEKKTKSLLPELLTKFNSSNEDKEVELLSGIKGLEIIFREQVEILSKGETCYVIGGTGESQDESVQAFFEKIHVMREEKGIFTKMLFNKSEKKITLELYSSKKYPHTKIKFLEHNSPVAINVYSNRVVIIIFGKEISLISVKSQEVSQSFLAYFNLLWNSA